MLRMDGITVAVDERFPDGSISIGDSGGGEIARVAIRGLAGAKADIHDWGLWRKGMQYSPGKICGHSEGGVSGIQERAPRILKFVNTSSSNESVV